MIKYSLSIRDKLIGIFVLIKVLPLVVLALFAWNEISNLATTVEKELRRTLSGTEEVVKEVADLSSKNSIRALDVRSREAIERLTTDTARSTAAFLYDRDRDIRSASQLEPNEEQYRRFLSTKTRPIILHQDWVMDEEGKSWVPKTAEPAESLSIHAQNKDNSRDFHYRPLEKVGLPENRALYLEMTFVDLNGKEQIKVTTSNKMSRDLNDVSARKNTYCKAETYFNEIKNLGSGSIYVSEVIGAYVKGAMIGTYSQFRANKLGIEFTPEQSGYAGKENPLGKRFEAIIRWVMPVVKKGKIIGYVTLALDHTHIMEFTDHIVPTEERYSPISDAATGNYAFMWDYEGRNISHPRDYFIPGFDPETGERAVSWLDEELYELWKNSNESMPVFEKIAPTYKDQSLSKKPAKELTRKGFVALDCRYLNFAPQCDGWHNLTQQGGSGSFLIFWSGLWKLTTAASIPYFTGRYGHHPRGFGFVTIGANVHEFHRPAVETAKEIGGIETTYRQTLKVENQKNQALMSATLKETSMDLVYYTIAMIFIVILIAVFIASTLTNKITYMTNGIKRFWKGDRDYRLEKKSQDEMGQLAQAFNEMADRLQQYIDDIESSKQVAMDANIRLTDEIKERQQAEKELAKHRDNLGHLVKERTIELKKEIVERETAEDELRKRNIKVQHQQSALIRLITDNSLFERDFLEALKIVLKVSADTLAVERSTIWLLNESQDQLQCLDLYLKSENSHTTVEPLQISQYNNYIEAVKGKRSIEVHNTGVDPRTIEFNESGYFKEYSITSMLDAAIRMNGEFVGIVCFEHTGDNRLWSDEEGLFAGELSDIIAQILLARERKQAAETLSISKKRYEIVAQHSSQVIYDNDIKTKTVSWAGAVPQVTGYSLDEFAGVGLKEWKQLIHADDLAHFEYSTNFNKKTLDSFKLVYRIKQKNGDYVSIEDEGAFLLDDEGHVTRVLGTVKNIMERLRTQEVIIQTEKMLSVGGLAAGMAHEINNPLAAILQNVQVIQKRLFEDLAANRKVADELGLDLNTVKEYLSRRELPRSIGNVILAGQRAAKIVSNMLAFSRKSEAQFAHHDLRSLVDKTIQLAENDYDLKKQHDFKTINIVREYDENIPEIVCEESKIQQVVLNLLKNSAYAISESQKNEEPRITVRVFVKNGMAQIEVEDNGSGMDETVRKRVFEPFYTTKPVGVGTGLGLSVSYFIVQENHGGMMDVTSEPGEGTAFIVRLPLASRIHNHSES